MRAAAAMLFEGLLRPGLNPGMGAAAARRYVSRKATITILNHRKTADGGVRSWEALDVSERRHYTLLKQFAHRNGARYEVDAGVLEQIRRHLISRDQKTEKQAAAHRLAAGPRLQPRSRAEVAAAPRSRPGAHGNTSAKEIINPARNLTAAETPSA
jgi:hypothetical protein